MRSSCLPAPRHSDFPMSSPATLAVVTGAGSGVGRAVALRLVVSGWRVVIAGRRMEALETTIATAPAASRSRLTAVTCDVGDAASVAQLAATVFGIGTPSAFVAAAGTNTPRRSWTELSRKSYRELMRTNLDGAFYCVQAFIPAMRAAGGGTFVFVNSEAGRRASAKSGVGYSASKFGLTGLAQSLNAEERSRGIRACSIFPGDIDTPLLEKRPLPPSTEARAGMLQPDDIAACVQLAIELPPRALVEEIVVRPASAP